MGELRLLPNQETQNYWKAAIDEAADQLMEEENEIDQPLAAIETLLTAQVTQLQDNPTQYHKVFQATIGFLSQQNISKNTLNDYPSISHALRTLSEQAHPSFRPLVKSLAEWVHPDEPNKEIPPVLLAMLDIIHERGLPPIEGYDGDPEIVLLNMWQNSKCTADEDHFWALVNTFAKQHNLK